MLLLCLSASATHNRAGEITYTHISGFTYEVTIRTCTDISLSTNADREFMPIDWSHVIGPGNNTQDSIARTAEIEVLPGSIKENYYTTEHTFPGPGQYVLYTEDPNRNAGVNNIPGSIDQIFSITTTLFIYADPAANSNNSVQLLNPPKEDGCVNRLWSHGVSALDIDGDSLGFQLIACTGGNMLVVDGYSFPDQWPNPGENGVMTFDQEFGVVTWDSPQFSGLYNIAIRITEYRRLENGLVVQMGSVVRDMQIDIGNCPNQPPIIDALPNVCVVAGEDLAVNISAGDPNLDLVVLTLEGEPFENSDAVFTQLSNQPATGTMQWNPDCSDIRLNPYLVYVRAVDEDSSPELSDNDGFSIEVIAPAVQDLSTQVLGDGDIGVSWSSYECSNAVGFKVYRRLGSQVIDPGPCETGMPASAGYTLIGSTSSGDDVSFVDPDAPFGSNVCYRVIACFADGSESIVSDEDCSIVPAVIPIMTHASVGETDTDIGRDTVRWMPPVDLDTLGIFFGPYSYDIHRRVSDEDFVLIHTTAATSILDVGMMQYVDESINTEELQYEYRVTLLNDGEEVASSNLADSPFLTAEPGDEQVLLNWENTVPWLVDTVLIQIFDDGVLDFITIGTSTTDSYLVTALENNTEVCFRVITVGGYELEGYEGPFLNYSQEVCALPFDNTPPCPPVLTLEGECEDASYELGWSIDLAGCANDAAGYFLYYSATDTGALELLQEIPNLSDSLLLEFGSGFVGCFAVSAYDSLSLRPDGSLQSNESELSNIICIESCPEYELPNIITPNGDAMNDVFEPFMPYSYVDSIDLKIFNRWGNLLFESTDPDIDWKARNKDSGELVSDGVYFYTIVIYEKRLSGLTPRDEAGTIQVLDNRGFESE